MQKIQSYLYPNRSIVVANVAGFTVENKVAYARTLKIYSGIDNVLEFEVQNADQKRIDLTQYRDFELNIMDEAGNALSNSPYYPTLMTSASATGATVVGTTSKVSTTTITIPTANITGTFGVNYILYGSGIQGLVTVSGINADIDSATTTLTVTFPQQTVAGGTNLTITNVIKGLLTVTIPDADLDELADQYLTYSLTTVDTNGNDVLLYADSNFNGAGKIQLIGNAMPTFRDDKEYTEFYGEINFMGNVITHTSAIPCKFYEAEKTETMSFTVYLDGFIGQVYLEATTDMTISVGSFLNAPQIQSFNTTTATTTVLNFDNIPIGDYNYFRISWVYPDVWQYGSQQNPVPFFGQITKVIASSN